MQRWVYDGLMCGRDGVVYAEASAQVSPTSTRTALQSRRLSEGESCMAARDTSVRKWQVCCWAEILQVDSGIQAASKMQITMVQGRAVLQRTPFSEHRSETMALDNQWCIPWLYHSWETLGMQSNYAMRLGMQVRSGWNEFGNDQRQ